MNQDLTNSLGERIDYLIEGNSKSSETIVFVHGIGTNKDDSFNLLVDFSNFLKDQFRIIRFDLSGCGQSQGRQKDGDYNKWADDLKSVLGFAKTNFPGDIDILAQSMGCFVTLSLNPSGVRKTVFLGMPNADVRYYKKRFVDRIKSRSRSIVDFQGTTLYQRADGKIWKIGPSFWQVLESFNPLSRLSAYSQKTELMRVHYRQDELVGTKFLQDYNRVPEVKALWLDGDHSLTKPEERWPVMQKVKDFFLDDNLDRG